MKREVFLLVLLGILLCFWNPAAIHEIIFKEKAKAGSTDRQGAFESSKPEASERDEEKGEGQSVDSPAPTHKKKKVRQRRLRFLPSDLPGEKKLEEVTTKVDSQGRYTRVKLVKTSLKYPRVLIRETREKRGQGERLLHREIMAAGHLLLKVREGVSLEKLGERMNIRGYRIEESLGAETLRVSFRGSDLQALDHVIADLSTWKGLVRDVEPDYLAQGSLMPRDPRFGELWGLHNVGQSGGSSDIDIDAPEAWDLTTGKSQVLVAVVDSGIDVSHPDLRGQIYHPPFEVPGNGVDDDGNGYIDDYNGWDFYDNDNHASDEVPHGTHCAGTIGAAGDTRGVVGVNWSVRLLNLKFIGPSNWGYYSDAVKAIRYAIAMGARVHSHSWGGTSYSSSLKAAIDDAGRAGMLTVAAAGNSGENTDQRPHYPSSYSSDGIISVGAISRTGEVASWSNRGALSVDLFAPGVSILSTMPEDKYAYASGTSMATPHVSGVAALLLARDDKLTLSQLKSHLLSGVDVDSRYRGLSVSSGRLNAHGALLKMNQNRLVATPSSLDFGRVTMGQVAVERLELRNTGTTPVQVSFIYSDNAKFSQRADYPFSLGPGQRKDIDVVFSSAENGLSTGELVVLSNAVNPTLKIPLRAQAQASPKIEVSPALLAAKLAFDAQTDKQFRIENQGGGTLDYEIKGAAAIAAAKPFEYDESHQRAPLKGMADPRLGQPVLASSGGPDAHGYRWRDSGDLAGPVYLWQDIRGAGKLLAGVSQSDDDSEMVDLGFDFPFYGKTYRHVYVGANGLISFTSGTKQHAHFALPSVLAPRAMIAACHTDLSPTKGGEVHVLTASDSLTIQYSEIQHFNLNARVSFQIRLERGGDILLQYREVTGELTSYSVGMQDETGTVGLGVAYNTRYLKDGLAIRFSTRAPWLRLDRVRGSLAAGAHHDIRVQFHSKGMRAGLLRSQLIVASNDTQKPDWSLPVTMEVTSLKGMRLSVSSLDFGKVAVGQRHVRYLELVNTGNDRVQVTRATHASEFSIDPQPPFVVNAYEQRRIAIGYTPTSTGLNHGAMLFETDMIGSSTLSLQLFAEAESSPKIELDPQSLKIGMNVGESRVIPVLIKNSGEGVLKYSLEEIVAGSSKSMKVPEAAQSEEFPDEKEMFAIPHLPGELIVGMKSGELAIGAEMAGLKVKKRLDAAMKPGAGKPLSDKGLFVLRGDAGSDLKVVRAQLLRDENIRFVEPNYRVKAGVIPQDPQFSALWGLHNNGQTGGVVDADIDAPEAWELERGNAEVKVAVIDTGVDYRHPDLVANMWVNPGEIPGNRIDDDGNGYVDDIHGYDFANNDADPMDDHYHGTHCAGTIAARGDNGLNLTGVAWKAKIVALKFMTAAGGGTVADAVEAVAYALAMEVPISNNSWGGTGRSQAMAQILDQALREGHLFIAAAGNEGTDNDALPHYPANHPHVNVVSVAASDARDQLAVFSNFGRTSVDVAAPGVGIWSLMPGNKTGQISGTSMAAPHVAGLAALLLSRDPGLSPIDLATHIAGGVDKLTRMTGKLVHGGRINARKSLERVAPPWLSITPSSGELLAGAQATLLVKVDTRHILAGTHEGSIHIKSNDPQSSTTKLKVSLDLKGIGHLVVHTNKVVFEKVHVGQSGTVYAEFENTGSDDTLITGITSDIEGITSGISLPYTLKMKEKLKLAISFNATKSMKQVSGVLRIASNAYGGMVSEVPLEVTALYPPKMALDRNAVSVSLKKGSKGTGHIRVSNLGEDLLEYQVYLIDDQSQGSRWLSISEDKLARSMLIHDETLALPAENGSASLAMTKVGVTRSGPAFVAAAQIAPLLFGADHDDRRGDVLQTLVASGRFPTIVSMPGHDRVPKLEELLKYDVVFLWSNKTFIDPDGLGDVLADYVDQGGGVVLALFESAWYAPWSLGGRWKSEQYGVVTSSMRKRGLAELGIIPNLKHPVVQGLKNFSGGSSSYRPQGSVMSGCVKLAEWSDGNVLAAERTDKKGRIVYLGIYPPSSRVRDDLWDATGEGEVLINNALSYAAMNARWVRLHPMRGELKAGQGRWLDFEFETQNLDIGEHRVTARLLSNDPALPVKNIPVTLTVRANQTPRAFADNITLDEDAQKAFTLRGVDDDGDALNFELVERPKHGTLVGSKHAWTYIPNRDFHGADALSYRVSDGEASSAVAKVTITVNNVNDVPIAKALSVKSNEDESCVISFDASDVDDHHSGFRYEIKTQPNHGKVVGDGARRTYQPHSNFHGHDEFSYRVSDSKGWSAPARVSITIAPINDPPVAEDTSITTPEDVGVNLQLRGSDVDGDTLSYTVIGKPKFGLLLGSAPNLRYIPKSNFYGQEELEFKLSDGKLDSRVAKLSLEVQPRNDPPITHNSQQSLKEEQVVTLEFMAADVDGDSLSIDVLGKAQHGVIERDGKEWRYVPRLDFNGEERVKFRASDGQLVSNTSTLVLKVLPVNDAPVAKGGRFATLEDQLLSIKLDAADPDGDVLVYQIIKAPQRGKLEGKGPQYTYVPQLNYFGSDAFSYRVKDGALVSQEVEVKLDVRWQEDKPQVQDLELKIEEDQTHELYLPLKDADGEDVEYQVVTRPLFGRVSIGKGLLKYTPNPNFHGKDVLSYSASDAKNLVQARVNFEVMSVNDTPQAQTATHRVIGGEVLNFDLGSEDVDGDALSYRIVSMPTRGVLSGEGKSRQYHSQKDFTGFDELEFSVSDGKATSGIAKVRIEVMSRNEPPPASQEQASQEQGTQVPVKEEPPALPPSQVAESQPSPEESEPVSETNPSPDPGSAPSRPAQEENTNTQTPAPPRVENFKPTADAGVDLQGIAGRGVRLFGGNSSDPESENSDLGYYWQVLDMPAGAGYQLSSAFSMSPVFSASTPGDYLLGLSVRDAGGLQSRQLSLVTAGERGDSGDAYVYVSIHAQNNRPPRAEAGPGALKVEIYQKVTLDGSMSGDPDGDAINLSWSFLQRPTGSSSAIHGETSYQAHFFPDRSGVYRVLLRVSDDKGTTSRDVVEIHVRPPSAHFPVADAGPTKTLTASDSEDLPVALEGSGSDIDGGVLTYAWRQVEGPSVTISDASISRPTFTIHKDRKKKAAVYAFVLRVTDQTGLFDEDRVHIAINTPGEHVPEIREVNSEVGVSSKASVDQPFRFYANVDALGDVGETLVVYWQQLSGPAAMISYESASPYDKVENEILVVKPKREGSFSFGVYVEDGKPRSLPGTVNFEAVANENSAAAATDEGVSSATTPQSVQELAVGSSISNEENLSIAAGGSGGGGGGCFFLRR